jgi:hypothetical protein
VTNFDDPRIAKLPHWAQELIDGAATDASRAEYWRRHVDRLRDEIDRIRAEHAKATGPDAYDTWTAVDQHDGSEVRRGIGTGDAVYFGKQDDVLPDFAVSFRDGGLDITCNVSGYVIRPSRSGMTAYTLRIE